MALLTGEPLDLGALVAEVVGPHRGAVATFLGLVRDHHEGRSVLRLEYSAYPDMAEAEATAILGEASDRWPVELAARHRTGVLEVGEAAVAVAAAGAHRGEAFEACRYVIEELKRRVPIWKREYYADGSVGWVEPRS
ncbi:MAG TPA: molybdenum cofactor biosynthesis protein MoaE [Gemmatimonadales bacterium]|nr:molybdenum cofactor biosynthesis protein MoaE [Gemmatimonadales bacterium]